MKSIFAVLLAVLFLTVGGCDHGGDGHEHDHSGHDHDGDGFPDFYDCAEDNRADAYVANLEKIGPQGIKVILVESTPAPPRRGLNDWHLRVEDDQGAPLDNLTLTVDPTMPDHGHGTSKATAMPMDNASGEYMISAVNLRMAGYWQVSITVEDGTAHSDKVAFGICIEG